VNIHVQDLKISFGDFNLKIQNWSLPDKSHLLVEGPSGTGKTSFLHLLAGLIPIPSGKIRIGEHEISSLSRAQLSVFRKNHCGIIFQKIHLLPHLTLQENILIGCKNADQAKDLSNYLATLGLQHRSQHLPSELSLGETQRASVARALISQPEIIFADEPTSGLDDTNAEKVLRLLQKSAQGKTLILVSHDHRARSVFEHRVDFRELLR
jgi:putative ABC transport system ATP-binding protein